MILVGVLISKPQTILLSYVDIDVSTMNFAFQSQDMVPF